MRILVVEDDKKIARAVKMSLELERFAVDVAEDGLSGYDLAATTGYDLIILDLMLPGMDGMEICKNLRSEGKQVPILILTARGETDDKVLGLNSGADDYLSKPFALNELMARVRSLLRRSDTYTSNELVCGDLKLNSQTFNVSRRGREISLSKKEFSLLEYMLRNKNRVLTKDDIIEHVWNYDADVLPNTVEVYIGYLRNKVDKPFKDTPPLLKTVWGFGYKLEEPNV